MCGVLGDPDLFDYFLDYNVVAQDVAGVPAWPVPADYLTNAVPRIEAATGLAGLTPGGPDTTNDLGKQLRAITVDRSGGPRPGAVAAFSIWKDFLFSLATQAGRTAAVPGPGQPRPHPLHPAEPDAPGHAK